MNGVRDSLVGQHEDHPLDQTPAGEMDDIAVIAASVGADRRFRSGIFAEASDQFVRVGKCVAVRNMYMLTQMKLPGSWFSLPG